MSGAAKELVTTRVTGQPVVAGAPMQLVVINTAPQPVVVLITVQNIGTTYGFQIQQRDAAQR